ncbi:MAG: DUF1343 domain-containing protein [Opitutales bacterium]
MQVKTRLFPLNNLVTLFVLLVGMFGCSSSQPPLRRAEAPAPPPQSPRPAPAPAVKAPAPAADPYPVMLGIDVLEAEGFAAVKGKRIGLLTHPAGVNRRGESTVDVLRRAPGVKLVALFAPEHGIYGDEKAEVLVGNHIDRRTGLPVYSVYDRFRTPSKQMLKGLDAMVIDLQDIGTRSYTFASAMVYTMAACFENNIEVIVLDRPNPLGGLKVDGPLLDPELKSYVGVFRVPYVHGLTIGELARMAKEAPGVMHVPGPTGINVSDAVRARGRLTLIPMRGWHRRMRWSETGLTWIATSPMIPDFSAVLGYPMVGLGTYIGGFSHGVGARYPFRGIWNPRVKDDVLLRELTALNLPGLSYRRISVPGRNGKPATGLYIEITDYDDWRPTELNFYLMALACKYDGRNPFATAPAMTINGFLKHLGSTAFYQALKRDGARTDVAAFIREWEEKDRIYQQQSRKFWLYN